MKFVVDDLFFGIGYLARVKDVNTPENKKPPPPVFRIRPGMFARLGRRMYIGWNK